MNNADTSKNWLITGASRGLGRLWATAALERGDHVAVVARDTAAFASLVDRFGDQVLPLAADVADPASAASAVHTAEQHLGGIDVLVNNSGHMLVGAVEEATDAQIRASCSGAGAARSAGRASRRRARCSSLRSCRQPRGACWKFADLGIDSETRPGLLAQLERSQLPDSATGSNEVRSWTEERDSGTATIVEFADGSRGIFGSWPISSADDPGVIVPYAHNCESQDGAWDLGAWPSAGALPGRPVTASMAGVRTSWPVNGGA